MTLMSSNVLFEVHGGKYDYKRELEVNELKL